MREALSSEHPDVYSVLYKLADPSYLDAAIGSSSKNVVALCANIVGEQISIDGGLLPSLLQAVKAKDIDAGILITAMSGAVPSRHPYRPADFVMQCERFAVPCFLVRDGTQPLMKLGRNTYCGSVGGIHLENAFSGELDRVVQVIHGALNATTDVHVAASAVHAFYRQDQYPPKGWVVQPERMVRI